MRGETAAFGVEVAQLSLKGVVLSGEMWEILNRVVAAEKDLGERDPS